MSKIYKKKSKHKKTVKRNLYWKIKDTYAELNDSFLNYSAILRDIACRCQEGKWTVGR